MGRSIASRFENVDLARSVLRGVIIDDDEMMLEMDFCLEPDHPKYEPPGAGEECCFHPGVLRFAGISELDIDRVGQTDQAQKRFAIQSCHVDGTKFDMECDWGTIHLQARSIRVLTD